MVEKNMVFKNPNWKETDQLAIYKKCSQGVALGATEDKCSENQDGRLELGTTRLLAQRPNSLTATLPLLPSMIFHVTLLYRLFLTFLIQTDGPVARQAMIVWFGLYKGIQG